MGYDPELNLIVFATRGSKNAKNWMDNANFLRTNYPYCEDCSVHEGFLSFWNDEKGTVTYNMWEL